MAFWAFSSIFLYSQYYFHPVGPHCPKIFTVLGLCPLVTFARQNVDWSETQYPKHTTKARRYIHIFKTYWRTSSCTAHEFVRRALLTQNGAQARAPSYYRWFRIDVNGHKSLACFHQKRFNWSPWVHLTQSITQIKFLSAHEFVRRALFGTIFNFAKTVFYVSIRFQ